MTTKYGFKEQLAKGEAQEAVLDAFFRGRGWKITPVDMTGQRSGVDRWFEISMLAMPLAIEYKADFKAGDTGNAYLETVSVAKYNDDGVMYIEKRGWVWTSSADYIMYYIPSNGALFVLRPEGLRDLLASDEKKYRSVPVRNRGYFGMGRLVPLDVIAGISEKRLSVLTDI